MHKHIYKLWFAQRGVQHRMLLETYNVMSNEICETFVNALCFGIEHKLIELKTSTELAPTHRHKLAKLRIPTIWFLIYRFHGLLILILLTLTLGTYPFSTTNISCIHPKVHTWFFFQIYLPLNKFKKKGPPNGCHLLWVLVPHILFWWLCFFLIIIYFEFCPLLPILLNVISHILCGVLCRWWHS